MDISSKIGTYVVTLEPREPDIKLVNYMSMNHTPLTPDIFPYYAGTWIEDQNNDTYEETYEEWLENERYLRELALQEDANEVLEETNQEDNYILDTSLVQDNTNKNVKIPLTSQEIQDYSQERASELNLIDELAIDDIKEEVVKLEDVHEKLFNDLDTKDNLETIKVSKPVDTITDDIINDTKSEVTTSVIEETSDELSSINEDITKKSEKPEEIVSVIANEQNQEPSKAAEADKKIDLSEITLPNVGYDPKFIVNAKNDDEYYDAILAEYDKLLASK